MQIVVEEIWNFYFVGNLILSATKWNATWPGDRRDADTSAILGLGKSWESREILVILCP